MTEPSATVSWDYPAPT